MSDIEVDGDDVSRRKMDWKGNRLRDMRSGGAVKELKLNRRYRFGGKVVVLNVFRVDKTMARTGVNQGKKTKDGNDWGAIRLHTGANFRRERYSE